MHRKLILTALASAAILCSGQAVAAGGPGGGGSHGGGGMGNMGGGLGNMGNMGQGLGRGDVGGVGAGAMTRDDARINSQGLDHASATGIANANANSVLAGTTATNRVTSGALAGVTAGMAVFFNGMQVGTVEQIRLAGNGNVALVLVKASNGAVFPVPAAKLSLVNGVLSTTARFHGVDDGAMQAQASGRINSQGPFHASATGIAHANQRSVLSGASTVALTGVSVGMPVFENGVQVGTVTRVITANGMIRRVLVQGTNGRTFSLSPNVLTASGGTLTTSVRLRGM